MKTPDGSGTSFATHYYSEGSDAGDLQIMNSSNNFVNYSDWWTTYVGRRYHYTISGMRAAKPTSAVRVFTAL